MPAVDAASTAARPLRIGVLGCADIALRRFLPAVGQSKRVRLAAIAGRDAGTTAAVARQQGCAAMRYDELLCSDQVDLVYIPLPNHLHAKWVVTALNHGKHVLCEKPLGLAPVAVSTMLELASRNGLLLYENIMYLQHPQHATIREMLATGRIGALQELNCVFTIPGPPPGNFRLDPQQGGGAFHDMNRYPLSAARFFLRGADFDIIRCDTGWQNGMIMSLAAEARTSTDERFSFTIAFGQPYQCFYEMSGTRGTLRLERAFTAPADHHCRLDICSDGQTETTHMPAHDHFLLTIEHVAQLIAGGGNFAAEHERCLWLAGLADQFFQQAQKQRGHS